MLIPSPRVPNLGCAIALAVAASGCGTDPSAMPPADGTADAPSGTDQLPPQGDAALRAWLAAGSYLAWACEPAPHPARPPGAHGMNRICSNDVLSGSTTGEYPLGAASVKELHDSTGITGYAVAIKVAPGMDATSWYWYERIGDSVVADSVGAELCVGCHDEAARDHVFTRVE